MLSQQIIAPSLTQKHQDERRNANQFAFSPLYLRSPFLSYIASYFLCFPDSLAHFPSNSVASVQEYQVVDRLTPQPISLLHDNFASGGENPLRTCGRGGHCQVDRYYFVEEGVGMAVVEPPLKHCSCRCGRVECLALGVLRQSVPGHSLGLSQNRLGRMRGRRLADMSHVSRISAKSKSA